MKAAIYDLEIRNSPDDLPFGWKDYESMGISVLGICQCEWPICDMNGLEVKTFGEDTLLDAMALMYDSDLLISFNGIHFDLKVIEATYRRLHYGNEFEWPLAHVPHYDILAEIRKADSRKIKGLHSLDAISRATLCKAKEAHGAEMPMLFQQGKMEPVIAHCKEDVLLTVELAKYVEQYQRVMDGNGEPIYIQAPSQQVLGEVKYG